MKKNDEHAYSYRWKWQKILLIMNLKVFLLLFSLQTLHAAGYSQAKKFDVSFKNESMEQVLNQLQIMTGYQFFYLKKNLEGTAPVTLEMKQATLEQVLDKVLKEKGFGYEIADNLVSIKPNASQQEQKTELITVKGRVTDDKGNPLPGASVIVDGTSVGVTTDMEGRYTLNISPQGVIKVTFVGYKDEQVLVKGKTTIDVQLSSTAENLEEVTVVAFGTQKKESVVSSISTVRPMDLKSSNSDLTSSFAGRIPGMIAWQTGGLPVALTEEDMNTKFYIRGITSFQTGANIDPLILIDGVESSKLELSRIAPEDIETFSVLKDASATAMYGARGANGVILITTKKGQEGSVYASARYEAVFSMPTSTIDVVDPITYMKLYNEALLGRGLSTTPKYDAERIERTASGKYPSWVYPANDWYKTLFKDFNVNHHAGISIRGGSKVIQYYASVNYNRDQGMLKTDKLNSFDVNITNDQASFRTNLNINLKAGIQLLLNTSATLDKYHGPIADVSQAYQMAFNASPVDFAPLYPGDDTYSWPHLRFGTTAAQAINPYMQLQRGYTKRTRFSTTTRAEYIQNLSSLVKGLELRASVSLVHSTFSGNAYTTKPFSYALAEYDFETGKHVLQAIGAENSSKTLIHSRGQDRLQTQNQLTYEGKLIHTAAWKDHQTSLTAVLQAQEMTFSPVSDVLNGLPRRNLTFSMRGSYGLKNRYFIEGSFGYNGSERFAKKNRMGFFPAGGLAWVVSNEPFMQSISNILPYLKLRASYGRVGNDGIVNTPRYVFLPTVGKDKSYFKAPYPTGMSGWNRYMVYAYENPNIAWEIAEQANLGLELKMFKGIFECNLDVFQEVRHNILGYRRTIPAGVGIEEPPLDNIGSSRMRGLDFSGKVQHAFTSDFWVILNGTFTFSKSVYKTIEEATDKPDWQRLKGQEISQQIGYIAEGLFNDYAEIENSPQQGGDVMPGDIRYRDLNDDGVIDVNDATHIGYPETPRMIYGFQGFINYKNWEFNFAFQGSGKRSFFVNPGSISPFVGDHAMLQAIADDHWSKDNMDKMPFWPRLSTDNIIKHNPQEDWYNADNAEVRKSTYFMRECRFLRCTSLELAYNLPEKLMNRWGMQNIKFFVRSNNPFMFSNFKLWDVELGENGFNYPIQKTYTVGLNISF